LDDLRAAPRRRMPTELLRHLERIDAIREYGLGLTPSADLPAAPLGRLARSARTARPSALAALREPRRTATLAALFQTLEATALDALERLINRVRHRATLRLWHRLTQALSNEQRQKLMALVTSDDATLATLDGPVAGQRSGAYMLQKSRAE
jgi:hypothetical protein